MASSFTWSLAVVALAASAAHAQESPAASVQSISIDQALAGAEIAAIGLANARAKIVSAQQQVAAARSSYLPQVNGNASYSLTLASEFDNIDLGALVPNYGALLCPIADDANNVFCEQRYQDIYNPPSTGEESSGGGLPFGQRNTWRAGISASQQIYDFGRTRSNVRAAKVGVELAKLSEQQIRAQAVYVVGVAYYNAAQAQRAVQIEEESLASAETTLADAQLKQKNGAIAEYDVVRAEVARDIERNALVQAKSLRDQAYLNLKRVLLIDLKQPIELTSGLDLADDSSDADDAVGKALAAAHLEAESKNLLILQADLLVQSGQAARAAAIADRLPSISAVTDLGVVNYETQPFNTEWATNWTVGVALSVPIFDGFRRRALVKKAEADISAARANVDDGLRAVAMEAEQAETVIAAALETWRASAHTVVLAKRAYEIAELRFSQGASTQVELVDARLQLNQTQLNQARSAHDLRVARLRRALLPGLTGSGL